MARWQGRVTPARAEGRLLEQRSPPGVLRAWAGTGWWARPQNHGNQGQQGLERGLVVGVVWSLRVWGRVEKRWQCQDMGTGDRRAALAMEAQTSRVIHGPRGSAVFCPLPLPGQEGLGRACGISGQCPACACGAHPGDPADSALASTLLFIDGQCWAGAVPDTRTLTVSPLHDWSLAPDTPRIPAWRLLAAAWVSGTPSVTRAPLPSRSLGLIRWH